jgi:hypothetical protein
MPMPYTPEQALVYARTVGGALGFSEDQLPTAIIDNVLNGLEECQNILDAIGQAHAPVPLPQYVPVPVVEAAQGGRA